MDSEPWIYFQQEEMLYKNLGELFGIIRATERLEKAFASNDISSSAYEVECHKLIAQFKTLSSTLKNTSIQQFHEKYKMDCPLAIHRLVTSGVPATVEHMVASAMSSSAPPILVAECVENWITAMDLLKLNLVAVDDLHPRLSDLSTSINRLPLLGPDFEGKTKMNWWMAKLAKMKAADRLTGEEARQLDFDLESSYKSFMAALHTAGT